MRQFQYEIIKDARPETKPEIPGKIYWKARFRGKAGIAEFIWKYYERESEDRIPFYLPCIYMKECYDFLRRCGKIKRKQINMVLIDGEDGRTDYFLTAFLEEFNYLTIVTDRASYFESLQERAFQELGLLIDLAHSWEDKNLNGNLVWDFSKEPQKEDCYPEGSICFLPYKREGQRKAGRNCLIVSPDKIETGKGELSIALAESLLIPADFPFRETRCADLRDWCKNKKWTMKMKVEKPEKP